MYVFVSVCNPPDLPPDHKGQRLTNNSLFPLLKRIFFPHPLLRSFSFLFSALYATLVFTGQHYMRQRPKLNLRRPLVLWSLTLAVFRYTASFFCCQNSALLWQLYHWQLYIQQPWMCCATSATSPLTSLHLCCFGHFVPTYVIFYLFIFLVLSIVGAVRTGSYMFHILSSTGFRNSVCNQRFYKDPVSRFWAYAFVLSKAPELGRSLVPSENKSFCFWASLNIYFFFFFGVPFFRWHCFYCAEEAETPVPALVPPHHCAPLFLVLV